MYKTGSATLREDGIIVDAAINAFHRPSRFFPPHLEEGEVKEKVEAYKADERNNDGSVIAESIQREIFFNLGKNKYVGRLDQIRTYNNRPFIFDVKYSLVRDKKLLYTNIPALVIYAYALNVEVGGIINVRNYGTRRPVFIWAEGVNVKSYMNNINDTLIYKLYREGTIRCT